MDAQTAAQVNVRVGASELGFPTVSSLVQVCVCVCVPVVRSQQDEATAGSVLAAWKDLESRRDTSERLVRARVSLSSDRRCAASRCVASPRHGRGY